MPDETTAVPQDGVVSAGSPAVAALDGASASRAALAWTIDPRLVSPAVRRLAFPVILEQLLQGAVPLSDTIIIGHLGRAELAGVGASAQIEWLLMSALGALAIGANVIVSHSIGAGDRILAARAARQALLMGVVVAIGMALAGLLGAELMLGLLGSEPPVVAAGAPYLRILLGLDAGLVGMLIASATLRATGDSKTPAKVTAATVAANIALAIVLVYGLAGLPALGTTGAGIAASGARLAGAAILIALVLKRLPGRPQSADFAFDRALSRRILHIGLPAGAEQLLFSGSVLVFSGLLMSLGTSVFAAGRIVVNAISLSFLVGIGFGMATTVLVGQALGAGRPDLARLVTRRALRMAATYSLVVGATLLLAAEPIAWLFTSDREVVQNAIGPLRLMGSVQPIGAGAFVLGGALRGAGDTRFVMAMTGLSAWLVRLPCALIFGFFLGLGPVGAFSGNALDVVVRSLVGYARWRSNHWEKLRV